jgi:hypothetical protein
VDLLAMLIAATTPMAIFGAIAVGCLFFLLWGWLAGLVGVVLGYGASVWLTHSMGGVPVSPQAKGWLSLIVFLASLTLLAILTR